MRIIKQLSFVAILILVSACGSKKTADDDIFNDVEMQDVTDQDSLSLDTPDVPEFANSDGLSEGAAVSLALFMKSEQALKTGAFLWTKKFNPNWLKGCTKKRGAGNYRCLLKNNAGEKAVVVIMTSGGGVAQKIFIDSKGAGYPDFWAAELEAAGYKRINAKTYASSKAQTKVKIVFLKAKAAATLILERL